jgi:hypothetical protein
MNELNADNLPADMREHFDRCCAALDAAADAVMEPQYDVQPPSMLYHYTDGAGLLGILKGGRIWLSNAAGLNDPSEIYHGLQFGAAALKARAAGESRAAGFFATEFGRNMSQIVQSAARFYVACFSRSDDDLGQWRTYGANGRGFAIGFRGPELEMAFARDNSSSNNTIGINYDDDTLRQAAETLASIVLPIIGLKGVGRLDEVARKNWVVGLQSRYTEAMLRVALLFKHKAYLNEHEYRFLHMREARAGRAGENFRVRGSSLTTYVEFDWRAKGADLLHTVVTGPAQEERMAREFVEKCLEVSGIQAAGINIRHSVIPYRG